MEFACKTGTSREFREETVVGAQERLVSLPLPLSLSLSLSLSLEIAGLLFRKWSAQPRRRLCHRERDREKGGCGCGRLIIRVVLGRSAIYQGSAVLPKPTVDVLTRHVRPIRLPSTGRFCMRTERTSPLSSRATFPVQPGTEHAENGTIRPDYWPVWLVTR